MKFFNPYFMVSRPENIMPSTMYSLDQGLQPSPMTYSWLATLHSKQATKLIIPLFSF